MPIYEYRCESCGFQKEHLQKMSDPVLDTCPSCGKTSYVKQLSAAGFQLKGNGWYATDFKGGGKTTSAAATGTNASSDAGSAPACGGSCACHPS
ncbi:zinc ribbon domain-containing protein [Azoarcus sp. L1K30]|uniref:FmdB family zinc ribbon protein n=1 Tax=Azoarcus sp. L1K30 TaxID=2820277 RepID=UPI001B81B95B|nr:zinc ribbon domain-containing protein [Azoarcus sp. L1K30]MBR0568408.1 zinc ribbon domain-containing protein [Azoarcus sp. L1K30]